MIRRVLVSCLAVALLGCSGGDDDVPEASVRPSLVPTTSLAGDDAGGAGSTTDVPATDPATTTSTSLTPAPGADLPSAPPGQEETPPPTTTPGPLPRPSVRLSPFGPFETPVDIASRPLDTRIFVIEQAGRVRAVDDVSDELVLDISDLVTFEGERGLLGLAFHPDLDVAYVDYVDTAGNTVIAEYELDPVTAVFDPQSARIVMTIEQPYANHNGGDLDFGPDGQLYVSTGDGGSADDPERRALDLSSPLGKLLRIDPLGTADTPFSVPSGNPFADVAGADPTIWAFGLRNPWRISFDAVTGDLWIADVGQGTWEEVNLATAVDGRQAGRGANFGWSAYEGLARFNEDQPADGAALDGTRAPLVPPVVVYPHENGDCSVSGGAVYRGERFTDLRGWYVAGDFCSGRMFAVDTTSVGTDEPARVVEVGSLPGLAAVSPGPDGELYAVSTNGTVARLDPA